MAKSVLTAAAAEKYRPGDKRRIVRDGGARSLFLVVHKSGLKSWQMRFRRPGGKPAKLTLGPLDQSGKELETAPIIGQPLSVAAARQLAAAVLRERAMGADVFADHVAAKRRRKTQSADAAANTFGTAARQFIDEHASKKTRRWRETARNLGLLYPRDDGEPTLTKGGLAERWADKPITVIDSHEIYGVIDESRRRGVPGLTKTNKGLSDARGRKMARSLGKMFSWLLQHRRIAASPCVGVYVPPAPAARERVLTNAEIRWFWQACDKLGQPFGPLLRLLLLTGQRLNEVAGMRRDELREDESWLIPGARTKNHRDNLLPLPPLARELIESVPLIEGSAFVFTTNAVRPVSGWSRTKQRLDAAMLEIARKTSADAAIPPWTLHDLRRTAVTGMAELSIAPHVVEAVVNHVSGAKAGVAGIYNRFEYLPEKKVALERWAAQLQGIASGKPAKVVRLHSSRNRQ